MTRVVLAADTVHTMTAAVGTVVVIEDGLVTAIAERTDLPDLLRRGDELHDLGAATIVPGLIDAHMHPVLGTVMTEGVDLTCVTSLEQLAAELSAQPGEWIVAWGLDPNALEGAEPGAALLERLVPGRAAFVRFFDGHAAMASGEALRRAGITGPVAFDSSAEVVCDADGAPTGVLLEAPAFGLVERAMPARGEAETRDAVLRTLRGFSAAGLTGGHVLDLEPRTVEILRAIEQDGELPIRLTVAPVCEPGSGADGLDRLIGLQGTGGRRWRIDGVKFYADGTIDNGTAWLRSADRDGASDSPYWADLDEFDEAQRRLAMRGIPVRTHAIGDAAIEHVISTLARVPKRRPDLVHRLEHLEYLPGDLLPMMRDAGIAAGMQPLHCTEFTAADGSDNWSERLGRERAGHGWPLAAVRAAGVVLALGSDWPIAACDPGQILYSARTRRPVARRDAPAIRPEQGLSAVEALEGLTSHAARSVGDAHGGRLVPGARGDLTVLTVDPLAADAEHVRETQCLMTVVGGRIEHLGSGLR